MTDHGNETDSEQRSKAERAESVERMLSGDDPPVDPPVNDPEPPGEVGGASKVGESTTRRAEDIAKEEAKESGRDDAGTEGGAGRPTGTSTARDSTGVDPQDPDEGAPNLQTGDQGG
jgi:hypothetical protein